MRSNETQEDLSLKGADSGKAEWVYSMSAPRDEGQPDVRYVIGKPLSHVNSYIFLLPIQPEDEYKIWDIDVPLNIIVDCHQIECIAKGQIRNKEFHFLTIETDPNALPKDINVDALKKAYERHMRPGESVFETLKQEIGRQCLKYFDTTILNKQDSTRDRLDRVVNG